MSKKPKLSVNDRLKITPAQLEKMTESELKKLVADTAKITNRRINEFRKAHELKSSPATKSLSREHRLHGFTSRGKSRDELINEYKSQRAFLAHKSSNLKEWKKIKKETFEKMKAETGLTKIHDLKVLWGAVTKYKFDYPDAWEHYGSDTVKSTAIELFNNKSYASADELLSDIVAALPVKNMTYNPDFYTDGESPSDFVS